MLNSLDEIEYSCRDCQTDLTTTNFKVLEKEEAIKAHFNCSNCGDEFESYIPKNYFE